MSALSLAACVEAAQVRTPNAPDLRFEWGRPAELGRSWAPNPVKIDGLARVAHTVGRDLLLNTMSGEMDFVPGVNIGSTVPGRLPGELGVSAGDYRRWFPQIASVGLRAVRVYTILPPDFYAELAHYNEEHPEAPLYLIQGVWIPEREFYATGDLFSPAVREGFLAEISDAVAAVHGDLERDGGPGHASGRWTRDASPWLLAYSIGVEWDPVAAAASDLRNHGRPAFAGRYFSSTADATPTEAWLAEALDHTAAEAAERGRTMPLTFTNWPTTDPLDHPQEPLEREDMVGVDANHIRPTEAWPGGYFASYHAYPYYPDFLRHEPGLARFEHEGRSDPYAGYLAALRRHHSDMPLMITEFGVPSSMGIAHRGPLGRDQGDHSEQEAMLTDAELFGIIEDLGLSGAFVFEWTDEWFKFTWNTIDYELPGSRRQLWRNPLTNEEHFGLVAVEQGDRAPVVIDGDPSDWGRNDSQVIYEGRRRVSLVRASHDEAFLYLLVKLTEGASWEPRGIALGFDVLDGGNAGLPGAGGLASAADYAVTVGPGLKAQAWVRASNDPEAIVYGRRQDYFPVDPRDVRPGSGVWNPQRLILNRPLIVPSTGERFPVEEFDIGALRYGTTDVDDPAFDSRSVWAGSRDILEMRLPYASLGFSDPSSRSVLRVTPAGVLTTETTDRVAISIVFGGKLFRTNGYSWDIWNVVSWHERPKAGLERLAKAVMRTLVQ